MARQVRLGLLQPGARFRFAASRVKADYPGEFVKDTQPRWDRRGTRVFIADVEPTESTSMVVSSNMLVIEIPEPAPLPEAPQ